MSRASADELLGGRSSSWERNLAKLNKVRSGFAEHLSNLVGVIEDRDRQCLGLTIKIRPDGRFLGILKRDYDLMEEEVLFGNGDTIFEVLVVLNNKANSDDWKIQETWQPNK